MNLLGFPPKSPSCTLCFMSYNILIYEAPTHTWTPDKTLTSHTDNNLKKLYKLNVITLDTGHALIENVDSTELLIIPYMQSLLVKNNRVIFNLN